MLINFQTLFTEWKIKKYQFVFSKKGYWILQETFFDRIFKIIIFR